MTTARAALLGRSEDLEVLEGVLRRVLEDEPGFVVITGEAGIGKSSLLDDLTRQANAEGCLTLTGRASEYVHELPFEVFTDALDAYLASLDAQALDSLAADRMGALAAVFPSLSSIDEALEFPVSAVERFRVHRAVRDLLERLAARRPLVLILDDLHWADDASLELIAFLLRQPPQAEVMIAMALRPGQGDPGVAGIIDSIRNSPVVRTIELGPLSLADVKSLVRQDAEELHRLSGGNPFYALQLARTGSSQSDGSGFDEIGVPAAVAQAIRAELAGLSPDARSFAQAAAVVGDPFDLDVAAAALDSPEGRVLEALDELVWKDLLRVTEVPRRFRFRHPIVRSAIYSSCVPGVRLSSHARVAAYLAGCGASAGEMAYHVEQAARRGDLDAVDVLEKAGEDAASSAPTSAIRWFQAALRLLSGDAHPEKRAGVLTRLASSSAALGRIGDAFDALDEALTLSRSYGDNPVAAIVTCAQTEVVLGRVDDAMRRLEGAHRELDDDTSPDAVALAIALTMSAFQAGEYSNALEWGSRAALGAEKSEERGLLASALAAQALGAAMSGEVTRGLEIVAAASAVTDGLSDDELMQRPDALSYLATSELYLDRFVDSVRHGERCMNIARVSGHAHLLPELAPAMCSSAWMIGDFGKADTVLEDAIEAARLAGNARSLSWGLFNRALTAVYAGDIDLADSLGSESLELAAQFEVGLISGWANVIHSMTLLEQGRAATAVEQLIAGTGGDDLPLIPGAWRPMCFEVLTRGLISVGDLDRAATIADRARREAEGFNMDLPLLMADQAQAQVALASGRPEEAFELASAAVTRAETIQARAYLAISRALAGRALAEAGRAGEAVQVLTRAAGEFDELGMKRYRDRTEALLRKLGHSVHRRSLAGSTGSGVESLTGRELEIATLVVDRRTNREIAEQLFLSTKTVETHMRNIFNKLGVSSRVEVARTLTT